MQIEEMNINMLKNWIVETKMLTKYFISRQTSTSQIIPIICGSNAGQHGECLSFCLNK
jgi:hypothetical protein